MNKTDPIRPLASGFTSFTEGDWRALVAKSARGRTADALASESDDGIAIRPLYAPDLSHEIASRSPSRAWRIVQRIDLPEVADAVRQIEEDVAGGAGAVELVFAGSPLAHGAGLTATSRADFDRLTAVLRQNVVPARVDAGEATPSVMAKMAGGMQATRSDAGTPSLTAAFDPVATMALQGGLSRRIEEIAAAVADLCDEGEISGGLGRAIAADGRTWHAAGASEVQELSIAIAAYTAWLRLLDARGIGIARAAAMIGMTLAADTDQFLTIGKFRAARLLIGRALEATGVSVAAAIHAETAWRMMSRREAHTNILRTTTAALAAALGGADSITVLPFDAAGRCSERFARRIARNSQSILVEEASLARVADPGAGSGAVEALTDRLAEEAWDQFRAIEAAGGLIACVRAGILQRTVATSREKRRLRVATRELKLTGINTFPVITSAGPPAPAATTPGASASASFAETVDPLVVSRLAEPFEALRDRADQLAASGRRPTVFLAMLGRPAEYAAIASDIQQVFTSGGMAVVGGAGPTSAEAAGPAFAASGATAACICPSTRIADAEIAEAAAALKANGAVPVASAGHGAAIPGLDFLIQPGINIVEFLGNFLERIARSAEQSRSGQ